MGYLVERFCFVFPSAVYPVDDGGTRLTFSVVFRCHLRSDQLGKYPPYQYSSVSISGASCSNVASSRMLKYATGTSESSGNVCGVCFISGA